MGGNGGGKTLKSSKIRVFMKTRPTDAGLVQLRNALHAWGTAVPWLDRLLEEALGLPRPASEGRWDGGLLPRAPGQPVRLDSAFGVDKGTVLWASLCPSVPQAHPCQPLEQWQDSVRGYSVGAMVTREILGFFLPTGWMGRWVVLGEWVRPRATG